MAFGALLFLMQAVAREAGLLIGRRRAAPAKAEAEGVGMVVAAMLALLAFVLALTLSFANARVQERREGTLAEANAIGTAWLRAKAIDHPHAAAVARLLEEYAPLRRDFVTAPMDPAVLESLSGRSTEMQGRIWGHVAALVRERPDPITASLMSAVNEMFDSAAAERLAFATTLPPLLLWLLIGITVVSIAALGYQLGLRGLNVRAPSLILMAMWAVVIAAILDLGSARLGDVRASPAPFDWTIEGFADGVRIPPRP